MMWAPLLAAWLGAVAGPTGLQGGGQPLSVSALRFYSPASGTTTIEVVCELGLGAVASGGSQTVRYGIAVSVRDSTGLELEHSQWSRAFPRAVATTAGASTVESFGFRAAPGRYRVVVRAMPEAGDTIERALDVSAYPARPSISDLLVANAVRLVSGDSAELAAGEIRRGGLVLSTAPMPTFSAGGATLGYYAEVYSWEGAAQNGELRVGILSPQRRSVVQAAPQPVHIRTPGGMLRGSLDLTGLPAGDYLLQLRLALGDSAIVAEAPFSVRWPRADTASLAGQAEARPSDPFADAGEATLDSLYAPLAGLMEPSEGGVYDQLGLDGKRRFMRQFWARRDSTLGTGPNSVMVRFYRAVAYANQTFREHGAGQIPGWMTDRGRIFLRNGQWDEVLRRPEASPKPYEVWKYTRGRFRWYVFLDESGIGNYRLIGSNDRQEPGLQNWQSLLTLQENYDDVVRFLGLQGTEQQQQQQ